MPMPILVVVSRGSEVYLFYLYVLTIFKCGGHDFNPKFKTSVFPLILLSLTRVLTALLLPLYVGGMNPEWRRELCFTAIFEPVLLFSDGLLCIIVLRHKYQVE